jgi:hypothetical protein
LFLERRLERTAEQNGRDFDVYVDELLAEAWLDPLEWEAELATLDEVGETFGFASPRFLAELEEQADGLPELNQRLRVYSRRWQAALDDLRRENLRLFQDAHPEWAERLETGILQKLDAEARSSEAAALLGGLVPFTKEASERYMRLRDLRRKSREAQSAHYRAEVRLAVVLRMRALLTEIAGRFYMARYAPIEERTALAQLQTCEDLEIGGAVDPKLLESFDPLQPFPTLAEERQTLEAIMPGWMGIRYRPAEAADRDQRALPRGAVVVVEVLPDSPAADARLQAADILLGPPEAPFDEPHAVREWIMQNEPGEWVSLRLLRGGDERDVRLRLAAYPLKLPSPAKVGKNGETPPRSEESPPEPAPATETESK